MAKMETKVNDHTFILSYDLIEILFKIGEIGLQGQKGEKGKIYLKVIQFNLRSSRNLNRKLR